MLIGAEIFVGQIIDLSASLGIIATVLALIIAPFATELPKKLTVSSGCGKGSCSRAREHNWRDGLSNVHPSCLWHCLYAVGVADLELVSVLLTFIANLTL
jgi:Ca2+/Na+ antiporter